MQPLRLSVVIVSWGRPRALARCLTALSQMRSIRFEVIVVADPDGLSVARGLPFADRLILLYQIVENISVARNMGIAETAGDVIAFIDDDAVPEPDWAEAILSAFEDPDLNAVTGPVIGRNGISLQWGPMVFDRVGRDRWLTKDEDGPRKGEALKLHGTNMAFRAVDLRRTGGFDPSFRFYLDETDLAQRISAVGAVLRYWPRMRVHHGYEQSTRRRADRVPTDLSDIGASTAVFLRKHAPDMIEPALAELVSDQRTRLLRLARARKIGPSEMRRLMDSLQSGIQTGSTRDLAPVAPIESGDRRFLPLRETLPPSLVWRHGWRHRARALRDDAAADTARGQPSALLLLEPTPRKHRVSFTDGGWWEQTGGLYGPAARTEPRLQLWRYKARVLQERDRFFVGNARNGP